MSAPLVPRVRVIAVCDESLVSETEADVFTLENVRFDARVETFPHWHELSVYLLFSHYRAGDFSGSIQITQAATGRAIRYERFDVSFDGRHEYRALCVDLPRCIFPLPGYYQLRGEGHRRRSGRIVQGRLHADPALDGGRR